MNNSNEGLNSSVFVRLSRSEKGSLLQSLADHIEAQHRAKQPKKIQGVMWVKGQTLRHQVTFEHLDPVKEILSIQFSKGPAPQGDLADKWLFTFQYQELVFFSSCDILKLPEDSIRGMMEMELEIQLFRLERRKGFRLPLHRLTQAKVFIPKAELNWDLVPRQPKKNAADNVLKFPSVSGATAPSQDTGLFKNYLKYLGEKETEAKSKGEDDVPKIHFDCLDISVSGISLLVDANEVVAFTVGSLVKNFSFRDGDFGLVIPAAKVLYCIDYIEQGSGHTAVRAKKVGMSFSGLPHDVDQQLANFIKRKISELNLPSDVQTMIDFEHFKNKK